MLYDTKYIHMYVCDISHVYLYNSTYLSIYICIHTYMYVYIFRIINPLYPYDLPIKSQFTLWLFNIAMENGPFIDDFSIKTTIYSGFSMAMLVIARWYLFVETSSEVSKGRLMTFVASPDGLPWPSSTNVPWPFHLRKGVVLGNCYRTNGKTTMFYRKSPCSIENHHVL